MNYYQEVVLLPNVDIGVYFLWQKVYQQIHIALVDGKTSDTKSAIGVAFPDYDTDKNLLGQKLRLFSENEKLLEQMDCGKWLSRLSDYIHLSGIKHVPETIEGYTCFKQLKFKGNKAKLARRRAKRKAETLEQALAHFEKFKEQRSKLPYIAMTSQTNGHRFRLFIEKVTKERPRKGYFSCYGLSGTTTVPMF